MTTDRPLRLALAQFGFPLGAIAANARRITQLIAEARDMHGADVVVFPALALSGGPLLALSRNAALLAECRKELESIATRVHGIDAVVGWPRWHEDASREAISLLRDGAIVTTLDAQATDDSTPRWHAFMRNGVQVALADGRALDIPGVAEKIATEGASLLLLPDATHYVHDSLQHCATRLSQRATESGLALAWVNRVGAQDARVFHGASRLVDGGGAPHPPAPAFAEAWQLADFDPGTTSFIPVSGETEGDASRESLGWRALVLGTRDYARKNGFQRAWVGLSGGLDSALVLAIAVDALGAGNVSAVRLPSRYTSALSNDLAMVQAEALGVALHTLPIEATFAAALDTLAPLFEGHAPDLAEENLQSRCRGLLMMALSNKLGGLLLTTGNKSEYAVGYCTIYGDMCGGYAPLKDVYKTEAFRLARWRNAQGDGERIPTAVISRAPSAELRPDQRDEDSLPPYEVLDALLDQHLEHGMGAAELTAAGFDADTVQRVLRLLRISEWKRAQSAPGPILSRSAFGSGCPIPITSAFSG